MSLSVWPTVLKVQNGNLSCHKVCFSMLLPIISAAWPSRVRSRSLWWLSLSDRILSKALGTSQGGCHLYFFLKVLSPWLSPFQHLPAFSFQIPLCNVHQPSAPRAPPHPSIFLSLSAKRWCSFAMRTNSCQAKAAAPSALEEESRKYNPGNMSTKQFHTQNKAMLTHTPAPLTVTATTPEGQIDIKQLQGSKQGWHFSQNWTDTGCHLISKSDICNKKN